MLGNLQVVLPVFILIGAGYITVRYRYFSDTEIDAVMRFTQSFGIPALLFSAVARLDISAVFQPQLLISFYAGSSSAFIIACLIAHYYFKRPPGAAVAVGFTAMFSNTVLLGLPIFERAYGLDAMQPVYAIIAIHAPFGYFIGIATMEIVRADGRKLTGTVKQIAKEIFTNNLTIGIMLGFAVNLSGINLPQFFWSPIQMLVSAAIPAALFSLGGILVRYKLSDRINETIMVLTLKLFIHPAISYGLAVYVFQLPQDFVRAAVVIGAMAPGVNVYIFANIYSRAKGTAANAVLLGTVGSIISVSFWLYILGT